MPLGEKGEFVAMILTRPLTSIKSIFLYHLQTSHVKLVIVNLDLGKNIKYATNGKCEVTK